MRAIQGLLRARGATIEVDGIFGQTTKDAVKTFQAANGLSVTGIVRISTWEKLVIPVGRGDTGDAVRAAQRELNDKRRARLTINGVYDTATRRAVATFQKHLGMNPTGNIGPVTWRNLVWHYDYPAFSSAKNLCDYSVGNGLANWATGAAIGRASCRERV